MENVKFKYAEEITRVYTTDGDDKFINSKIPEEEIEKMGYEEIQEYPFDATDLPTQMTIDEFGRPVDYDSHPIEHPLKYAGYFLCLDKNNVKTIVGIDNGKLLVENTKTAIDNGIIKFDILTEDICNAINNTPVQCKFSALSDTQLKAYIRFAVEYEPRKLISELEQLENAWELNNFSAENIKKDIIWENYKLMMIQNSHEFKEIIDSDYDMTTDIYDKLYEIYDIDKDTLLYNITDETEWEPTNINDILNNKGYKLIATIEEIEKIK